MVNKRKSSILHSFPACQSEVTKYFPSLRELWQEHTIWFETETQSAVLLPFINLNMSGHAFIVSAHGFLQSSEEAVAHGDVPATDSRCLKSLILFTTSIPGFKYSSTAGDLWPADPLLMALVHIMG